AAITPATVSFFDSHTPSPSETYALSLHDALPISETRGCSPHPLVPLPPRRLVCCRPQAVTAVNRGGRRAFVACSNATSTAVHRRDRKSTRLNSSHDQISYAVFCLKKKTNRRKLIA